MSDFFNWSNPRARKDHDCDVCYRIILAGEFYHRCEGFVDGSFSTWKECAHCEAVIRMYGIEDIDGNRPSFDWMHSEWEPRELPELRHLAYYRKKWTCQDGTLYPIPD